MRTVALLFSMGIALSLFSTGVELLPGHPSIRAVCNGLAVSAAMISAGIGFHSVHSSSATRVAFAGLFGFMGWLVARLLLEASVNTAENLIDFPAATTRTSWVLLPIDEASRSQERYGGASWWVETPLSRTMLAIRHEDYSVMTSRVFNLKDGDDEPATVPSNGLFCAKVEVEEAGNAVRLPPSAADRLPLDSIGICADFKAAERSLRVLRPDSR
jgi:hypothetical protein